MREPAGVWSGLVWLVCVLVRVVWSGLCGLVCKLEMTIYIDYTLLYRYAHMYYRTQENFGEFGESQANRQSFFRQLSKKIWLPVWPKLRG